MNGRKKILLVEDDLGLVQKLSDRLRGEGYDIVHAGDGAIGEKAAMETSFDLIILDITLPQRGSFEVFRNLRQKGVATPILILVARSQWNEKVIGQSLGADDYLAKPFDVVELHARVEELLRRPKISSPALTAVESHSFGSVEVDLRRMEVRKNGVPIGLSAREFQLLRYFIEHRGDVLTRQTILHDVWGYDSMPNTRTVDTHVVWLRKKLEENPHHPQFIVAVHGSGYKFVG